MIPIKGFIKNTMVDWEGKIASVIFLPNCNWKCFYCHAYKLVCESDKIETIYYNTVYDFLKQKKQWIDGLVICGGEPTIFEDLPEFLLGFKSLGIDVKLDTNGANPEMLKFLIEKKIIDYIAMDIKAPLDKDRYEKITKINVDIENIKRSIKIVMNSGLDYEFRTTVSKQWLSEKDVLAIAEYLSKAKRIRLQKFRESPNDIMSPDLIKNNIEEFSLQEFDYMVKQIREKYIEDCLVR